MIPGFLMAQFRVRCGGWTPVILAFEKLKLEDHKFKDSLTTHSSSPQTRSQLAVTTCQGWCLGKQSRLSLRQFHSVATGYLNLAPITNNDITSLVWENSSFPFTKIVSHIIESKSRNIFLASQQYSSIIGRLQWWMYYAHLPARHTIHNSLNDKLAF